MKRDGMTRFETAVRIARPVDAVFAYVADPRHFADWNSAVERVDAAPGPGSGVGARYVMHRRLPGGPAVNELEITAWEAPREFAIRTTSGPTPFAYRYGFAPADGGTEVRLDAEVELGGAAALAPPLAARLVKRGVDANFAQLRELLESTARRGGPS
jgi:uncharacterized protein YndB with AHSA1/START domain